MKECELALSNGIAFAGCYDEHLGCILQVSERVGPNLTTCAYAFIPSHDLLVPFDHYTDYIVLHGRGSQTNIPKYLSFAVVSECDRGNKCRDEGEIPEQSFWTEVCISQDSLDFVDEIVCSYC